MRSILHLAAMMGLCVPLLHAQVPQLLNYQGRIVADGTNYSGAGQFRFALVNNTGTVTHWSNDGTSVAGSEPSAAVPLPVNHGLYSVLLGDAGMPGMTVLPASVFTNSGVYLRVWFDDGVHGSQRLLPDQRMAAVGYAMMAANVPDGIITSNKLANDAVTSAKIADGAITAAKLASNAVTSVQLNTLELGKTNVSGRLDVYRTASGTPAVSLIGNSSQISTYGSDGLEQIRLWGGGWGEIFLHNSLENNATAVALSANSGNGGYLRLANSNGLERAYLSGGNSGALLTLRQADGNIGVQINGDADGSGRMDLRNTNGSTRVLLSGQGTGGGGEVSINNPTGNEVLELLAYSYGGSVVLKDGAGVTAAQIASSGSGGGYSYLYNSEGDIGIHLDGDSGGGGYITLRNTNGNMRLALDGYGSSGGGQITAYAGDGGSTVSIYGDSGGGGLITVQNTNSSNRVYIDGQGTSGGGEIYLYAGDGSTTINLQADSGGAGYVSVRNASGSTRVSIDGESMGNGGEISVHDADGTETVQIIGAESSTTGAEIALRKADGTTTITLDADYNGNGRITTQEIEITGGSDLSEQFDIAAAHAAVEPGIVVCIDPVHPGRLVMSSTPYDRTVAGIVSGAGGVRPGMLMGQRGTKADGQFPVALTGRVYCLADATHGAIRPGDLLTTSATPGHAMKVTASGQAHGAIIGKAMTSLEKGRGLVLVLVSLQ